MTRYKVAKVDVHIQDVVFPAVSPESAADSDEDAGAEDSEEV